jgi:hypothetical protein
MPHTASTATGKEGCLTGSRMVAPNFEPGLQRIDGLSTHRKNSRLVAFARHTDGAICKIDRPQIERDEFRESKTRRIKEFHDGSIAERERVITPNIEQSTHLIDIECFG